VSIFILFFALVLLRKLQQPDFLQCVSHIIVDEVHERQVETDFLLTILKEKAPLFSNLRIALMSATMQEDLFSSYFGGCPILSVSGRTYPVAIHYLDEIDKLVAVGQTIAATGRGKVAGQTGSNSKKGNSNKFDDRSRNDNSKSKGVSINDLKPPSFDANRIAEFVIRIITTSVAKLSSYCPTVVQSRLDSINMKAAVGVEFCPISIMLTYLVVITISSVQQLNLPSVKNDTVLPAKNYSKFY